MVLGFVLFCLVFDHIVWSFIFIYAALTHSNKKQHHFHHDCHCHGWVYYVVLLKYGFKICVISFDFYWTRNKVYIHLPFIVTQQQTTVPFYITHVLSSIDCRTPRLYHGSADLCEVDCNCGGIFSMGASGDCRAVVVIRGGRTPNRQCQLLISVVANIYKTWVMRQKVGVTSPVQCKYCTFLVMGQDTHWLFLLPYLHLCAWGQIGVGCVAC